MGILIILALCYLGYGYASYHRLEDSLILPVTSGSPTGKALSKYQEGVKLGESYTAVSYNIGFGAYSADYSFFMDGGKSGRAVSSNSVRSMTDSAAALVDSVSPDFVMFQEIDVDGTRSHHIDQSRMLRDSFPEYDSVFCQNYDSFYIILPITEPHGANRSGLMTFSAFPLQDGLRRRLPVDQGFSKFFDLDRCLSIVRTSVENGKDLVLINAHLSAYSDNAEVREGQLALIYDVMKEELSKGNYVIMAGDFNHNLKEQDPDATAEESWCFPYPRNKIPENCYFPLDLLSSEEREALHNSCRNANEAYNPETSFTVTVDGFIVSDNIETVSYQHVDTGYSFSDHDPVVFQFVLR